MLNLNTKKAIVGKNAKMDWVSGSFGSKISMLYPMSILNGEGAKTEFTGISFAGGGQNLDNGFKVIHNAPPFISSSETIIFRIFLKSVLSGYNCIIVSLSDTVNTICGTLYKIFGLIFIS